MALVYERPELQAVYERILFVWSARHPASGYVQGINDLVTPFFLVFLSEHVALGDSASLASCLLPTAYEI